jgi:hypothetical protein
VIFGVVLGVEKVNGGRKWIGFRYEKGKMQKKARRWRRFDGFAQMYGAKNFSPLTETKAQRQQATSLRAQRSNPEHSQ